MDVKTKLRYQACITTPPLWTDGTVFPFNQIELVRDSESVHDQTARHFGSLPTGEGGGRGQKTKLSSRLTDSSVLFKNQRLGKLVEEFVFHHLQHQPSISWICDNLQIQKDQRTVGELDALYYDDNQPIHLEVVYKFYLYDTLESYTDPLGYWIGPNRKDSLPYKLAKLQNKQFPLLYHEATNAYLAAYNLDAPTIQQALCFKAQLFLPYQRNNIDFGPLNRDCVVGFYLSFRQLEEFKLCEFFIPEKLDWLITPHLNVNWVSYSAASTAIETSVNNQRSPLVWIKQNSHKISKCFVVFWE